MKTDYDHNPTAAPDEHPPVPPRPMRWQWLLIGFIIIAVGIGLGAAFGERVGHLFERGQALTAADHDGPTQYYTCGMHPWVILPAPGDCPICQMALTPLDPAKFTGEIAIDPVTVQNIGVRVAPVVTGPLTKTIRTVGVVDYNEGAVRDVNTKIAGWIEKVHLDSLGAHVKKGDPLFEIYSPQLYAAQEEYLLTLRNQSQASSAALLEAARTRLKFFDISDAQIDALAKAGEPSKTMTIYSPHEGVVVAKHANDGMKVEPGMQVYRIADLSKVWVLVTLYEYQLPYVQVGQKATMSLSYVPGQTFEGEVIYVYPYLDRKTREVQVRLEFDNEGELLKPGMFANVELVNTLAAERTLAPRAAVIDTGERQMAFVSRGEGKFEPRQVHMGVETAGGMVEILDGLKPGEMVVTSGQFLIDSESKIREALAKMIKGDLASEQRVTAELAGESELKSLPADVAASLAAALDSYMTVGQQLADDKLEGIADPARAVAASLEKAAKIDIPGDEHFWHKHQQTVADARAAALKLIRPADIAAARLQYGNLSTALRKLLMATGIPATYPAEVQLLRCPMYLEDQGGAYWLQTAGDVRNPYMGKRMRECFDERKAMPVTGRAAASEATPTEPKQPATRSDISADAQQHIDAAVKAYLAIHQMLIADEWKDAGPHLAAIREAGQMLAKSGVIPPDLASKLAHAADIKAGDLEQFREAFAPLSDAMIALVDHAAPSAAAGPVYEAYCPMVKHAWLQPTDGVRNPYDTDMLKCGKVRRPIASHPATHGDQGK